MGDADQVDGAAAAWRQVGARLVVVLECPHPDPVAPGVQFELVVDGEGAAGQGAGHHRAGPLGCERPVDPEPRASPVRRGGGDRQQVVEGRAQFVDADPGRCIHIDDRHAFEERALESFLDLEVGELDEVLVGDPDLGQGHEAVADVEKFEDPEVLLGLRLPALGGRHDEEAGIDRTHAGQHVLDEPDVARHVDQRQRGPRGQRGRGEAQVDREAAGLLLGEPVGIGAGERLHERGLSMVDVAGRGDDVHVVVRVLSGRRAGRAQRRARRRRSDGRSAGRAGWSGRPRGR